MKLDELKSILSEKKVKILKLVVEQGASSWLSSLPIQRYDFYLEKQAFWDALRLRYDISLSRLPAHCVCSSNKTVEHSVNCKRGGFVVMKHNDIRDLTCELLSEVCYDVEKEPMLTSLTGESFNHLTTNTRNEGRCDVSARGLWNRVQKAYVDIKVFNPMAKSYRNKAINVMYRTNEQTKKTII